MKLKFRNRSANDLRDRASAISPDHKKFQRCAYGLSAGVRCDSTRAQTGLVFQHVPEVAKVLSHMCIAQSDYSVHLRCCALHGQNTALPLSATNLPDHTAVLPKRGRPDPDVRQQQQLERHAQAELKRDHQERLSRRAECLAKHNNDPDETIDHLLGLQQDHLQQIFELQEQARAAQEGEQMARAWMSAFRPEVWEDVDDEWITLWTPFRNKTVCRSFFEVFEKPRAPHFESWGNFEGHKLALDASAKITQAVASAKANSPEEQVRNRFSRSNTDRKQQHKRKAENGLDELSKKVAKRMVRMEEFRTSVSSKSLPIMPRKTTTRRSHKYRTHGSNGVKLNLLQEFFVYMIYLRRGLQKSLLADKFFGDSSDAGVKRINSVLRTQAAALYEILRAEKWWLSPEHKGRAHSSAFSVEEWMEDILNISDCTGVDTEGSDVLEQIRQQLYSVYYGHECAKYCVGCSVIGGSTVVSPGLGGPASDHQCMQEAGLFDKEKWAVPEGSKRPQMLYDAGVSAKTKTAATLAGCDLVTSGIVRNSKKNDLSAVQRSKNFSVSSLRIRVENFIGIVKQRFQILGETHPIADLGMLDKIVYTCFMLHNFGPPIIN